MGVLFLPLTIVIAWALALFNVAAPGAVSGEAFADSAMRWMLFIPAGFMVLVSGVMHTVFAKSTAKNIGWQTNGFQYEIGFASFGFGLAGIIAAQSSSAAWLPVAVALSVFLVLAGANHIREMITSKNFAPGNSIVLLYDFGLPISFLVLYLMMRSS